MHDLAAAAWMAPMIRRILPAAALASLILAAPALAAPKANTITAIGGMKVKANAYVQDDQRWDADELHRQVGRDRHAARQVH